MIRLVFFAVLAAYCQDVEGGGELAQIAARLACLGAGFRWCIVWLQVTVKRGQIEFARTD